MSPDRDHPAGATVHGAGSPRWWSLALVAIFLLALAVRVVLIVESSDSAYHRYLVLDAATYHRIAVHGDPGEPYWQPPLYPWFLRGIYAVVGGPNPIAVRFVQALLGALTAVLTALVARRFAGAGAATAAGIAVSLYAPLATLDAELLPGSLATFLMTLFVLLLLARGRDRSIWRRIRLPLAGVVLGAAAILLPALALGAALALFWLVLREGWRAAVTVGLIALVPVAAVALRNRAYEPATVLVSWNGGVNLWLGNNPDYPATVDIRPGWRWTRELEAPRCEAGTRYRAEESAWFAARARAYALGQPLAWARDLAWKGAAAVSAREIGRNRDEYDARRESLVVRALLWPWGFPFVVLLPLAAAGTSALLRRHAVPWLPLLVALGVLAISIVFFPAARYRAPALPMLVVIAATGFPYLRWPDAIAGIAALGLSLVPPGIPAIPHAETLYEIAVDLDMDGRSGDALPLLQRAAREAPEHADVALYLGLVLGKLGQAEAARAELERAVALAPEADAGWQALAVYWHQRGDKERAREMIERAVQENGCNRRARALYAQLLMDEGRLIEAARQLDEAERVYRRPDGFVARARERLARLTAPATGARPGSSPPRPTPSP